MIIGACAAVLGVVQTGSLVIAMLLAIAVVRGHVGAAVVRHREA